MAVHFSGMKDQTNSHLLVAPNIRMFPEGSTAATKTVHPVRQQPGFNYASSFAETGCAAVTPAPVSLFQFDLPSTPYPCSASFDTGIFVTLLKSTTQQPLLIAETVNTKSGLGYVVTDHTGIPLPGYYHASELRHYTGHVAMYWEHSDAAWIEGTCVNGRLNGYGKLIGSDFIYAGQWLDDEMHGEGALYYFDGSEYEGGFQHGKKHGYGRYTDACGNTRKGYWVSDQEAC